MRQISKKNGILLVLGVFAMIVLTAFDQFTKYLAVCHLKHKPAIPILPGVFELSYLENHGAAFGILQGQKTFFILITVAAMAVMFYLYLSIPKQQRYLPLHLLFILLIPGAAGNFIDRCINNYVIDFFYFRLINFPVFNVADVYVSVATVFLMILFCFYYGEEDVDMIFRRLLFWKRDL